MRLFASLVISFVLAGCSQPPPPPPPRLSMVAVIGDSYTGGSNEGGTREHGWPALVTTQLDRQGVPVKFEVGAIGGSGYVNRGPSNNKVFADELQAVVHPESRLVVFFGSRNDRGKPPVEYANAVHRTFTQAKALAPTARLLVIGPPWVHGFPPPTALEMRDALRGAAESAGATFVDPMAEGWFTDEQGLIGADKVHPNDAGHLYMADKIAPLIAAELQRSATR